MKSVVITLIVSLSIASAAQAGSQGSSPEPSTSTSSTGTSGKYDYALSDQQESALEIDALRGSCEAAHRLYAHFEIFAGDKEEGLYWERIAAENGDSSAQSGLATLMSNGTLHGKDTTQETLMRDKQRAEFWYKRSLVHSPVGVGQPRCPQDDQIKSN